MLKISLTETASSRTTLQLEGRVIGPWVSELRQICEPLVSDGASLAIDLRDVTFADENGLTLLASLRTRGARLLNAAPFVVEQLRSVDASCRPGG